MELNHVVVDPRETAKKLQAYLQDIEVEGIHKVIVDEDYFEVSTLVDEHTEVTVRKKILVEDFLNWGIDEEDD